MIIAANYGTVSDVEILWVLISVCGFLYSLLNLRESHKDIQALKAMNIENGRSLIARTTRYQDAIRCTIHSIFLSIGIMASFIPETQAKDVPLAVFIISVAIRWGLIVSAALLVSQSYVARRTRRRLLDEDYGLR